MEQRLKETSINKQITNLNSVRLDYDKDEIDAYSSLRKTPTKVEYRLLNAGENT